MVAVSFFTLRLMKVESVFSFSAGWLSTKAVKSSFECCARYSSLILRYAASRSPFLMSAICARTASTASAVMKYAPPPITPRKTRTSTRHPQHPPPTQNKGPRAFFGGGGPPRETGVPTGRAEGARGGKGGGPAGPGGGGGALARGGS